MHLPTSKIMSVKQMNKIMNFYQIYRIRPEANVVMLIGQLPRLIRRDNERRIDPVKRLDNPSVIVEILEAIWWGCFVPINNFN